MESGLQLALLDCKVERLFNEKHIQTEVDVFEPIFWTFNYETYFKAEKVMLLSGPALSFMKTAAISIIEIKQLNLKVHFNGR